MLVRNGLFDPAPKPAKPSKFLLAPSTHEVIRIRRWRYRRKGPHEAAIENQTANQFERSEENAEALSCRIDRICHRCKMQGAPRWRRSSLCLSKPSIPIVMLCRHQDSGLCR